MNDSMSVDMLPNESMYVNMFFVNEPLCTPLVNNSLLEAALDIEQADDLATLFKALADPIRLRLISIIGTSPTGEVCACDLPALLDRTQPTISHHLSILVKAGLLDREQRGKWAWFSLRRDRLEALRRLLG